MQYPPGCFFLLLYNTVGFQYNLPFFPMLFLSMRPLNFFQIFHLIDSFFPHQQNFFGLQSVISFFSLMGVEDQIYLEQATHFLSASFSGLVQAAERSMVGVVCNGLESSPLGQGRAAWGCTESTKQIRLNPGRKTDVF
jgi:hypothetical protein